MPTETQPREANMPVRPVSLIMPMAGRGSRFAKAGEGRPKPLIDLCGRPFFWWACESVRRSLPVERLIFVVLQEHCDTFGMEACIRAFYPQAEVQVIRDVTAGAAETAMIGVQALGSDPMPVAINDCDHAFHAPGMAATVARLGEHAEGALIGFRSDNPAYSFIRQDPSGAVVGTVEKQVVGTHAIAGCYWFANAARLATLYQDYRASCPYPELFVSGLFNEMLARGKTVLQTEAAPHVSFGTPEELARINPKEFRAAFPWSRDEVAADA